MLHSKVQTVSQIEGLSLYTSRSIRSRYLPDLSHLSALFPDIIEMGYIDQLATIFFLENEGNIRAKEEKAALIKLLLAI